MKTEDRQYYDSLFLMAKSQLSHEEYLDWYDTHNKVSSLTNPDGIFFSIEEMREYHEKGNQ